MAVPTKKQQSKPQKQQQQNQAKNSQQSQKNLQPQQEEPTLPTINVDELAREKINEIEASLNSSTSYKLAEIKSWFSVLKQIILAADLHRTHDGDQQNEEQISGKPESGESIYADYVDDNEQFKAVDLTEQLVTNSVKWTIRVQAFKIVHRLVDILASLPSNNSSKSQSTVRDSQYLLDYLPDLVRLSFVSATSPYDDLKLQGFEMFKLIIKKFANIEEKELKGQSILEQYRAQILSALKPAFDLDAPPYIAAIASQACSLWIVQGLDRNLSDLNRTYQLFLGSIHKLEQQSSNQHSKLYTESELEQERLDILGSWAHILIACHEGESSNNSDTIQLSKDLSNLVNPCIESLIDKWWEALKDYALLIMPAPRLMMNLHENEMVYTREVALRLFQPIWPKLTLASAIWLCKRRDVKKDCDNNHQIDAIKCSKFICGIIVKELCDCQTSEQLGPRSMSESTMYSVKALEIILNDREIRSEIISDAIMSRELYLLLYGAFVKYYRHPNKILFKKCMDCLFSASLGKISEKSPSAGPQGLSQLITIITDGLQCNRSQSEEARLESRSRLLISLCNLVTIAKLRFEQISKDTKLLSDTIDVFGKVLEHEVDQTLALVLISQLKELYDSIKSHERGSYLISQVNPSKAVLLSRSLNSIVQSRLDKKTVQSPVSFENCLKSMLTDLDICKDATCRQAMLNNLVAELLRPLHTISDTNGTEAESKAMLEKKEDLIDLIVRPIKELRTAHAEDLSQDMKEQIEKAVKLEAETNDKLAKINKPKGGTSDQSANARRARPQNKITLKADFSNFYAQKL